MTYAEFIDSLQVEYFRGEELARLASQVSRAGVRNSLPPRELWPNIGRTLRVLSELRGALNAPITIISAYRSPEYNASIDGAPKSQHMRNTAIDFKCAKGKPALWWDTAKMLRGRVFIDPVTGAPFTFAGGLGVYDSFVHIDTRATAATWDHRK